MGRRTKQFLIRMSPDEAAMLADLATLDGLYRTATVRLLVRREHAKRLGAGKRTKHSAQPARGAK